MSNLLDKVIPKELQYDGEWPWVVRLKNARKLQPLDEIAMPETGMAVVISKDVGGLSLVATWVRTDSFTEGRD